MPVQEPTHHPVTLDDLALLRSMRNPTGYRHVYEHHREIYSADFTITQRRRRIYIAKIRRDGVLLRLPGSSLSATDCAKKVVRWYRDEYGERWRDAIRDKRAVPIGRVAA